MSFYIISNNIITFLIENKNILFIKFSKIYNFFNNERIVVVVFL